MEQDCDMACFHPIPGYQSINGGQVKFGAEPKDHKSVIVPCGQCIGCRLERSRQWAMRCVHEASMHNDNCFITLTYDAENLPPDTGLRKRHWQDFIRELKRQYGKYIRYYHCGEYGDRNNRPHYHAILFGHNFEDWVYLFDSPSGEPIYTSPTLERIWKKGFVTVGSVTFQSAGYVARYCMKKINGRKKEEIDLKTGLKHYERINSFTGEIVEVLPEYSTMSRGGRHSRGIGFQWFNKYKSDIYPKDFTTIRGVRCAPPRVYDKYLESIDPMMYDDIKAGRKLKQFLIDQEKVPNLSSKEKVKKAQFNQLKRSL